MEVLEKYLEKFNSNKFTYTFFSVAFFVMLFSQSIIAYLDTTYTRMFFIGGTTVALLVVLGNLYIWWDEGSEGKRKENDEDEKDEKDESITPIEEWKSDDFAKLEILENQIGGK